MSHSTTHTLLLRPCCIVWCLQQLFTYYADLSRSSPDEPMRIVEQSVVEFALEFLLTPVHVPKAIIRELFESATTPTDASRSTVRRVRRRVGGDDDDVVWDLELAVGEMGYQQWLWFLAQVALQLRTHRQSVAPVVQVRARTCAGALGQFRDFLFCRFLHAPAAVSPSTVGREWREAAHQQDTAGVTDHSGVFPGSALAFQHRPRGATSARADGTQGCGAARDGSRPRIATRG